MDCVKLEGGVEVVNTVKRMVTGGIPVMGHIGLLPQRVSVTMFYSWTDFHCRFLAKNVEYKSC